MVRVRWLGHAFFEFDFGRSVVLVDPFVTGNPKCPESIENITRADVVCVTHDHHDHLGDAVEICKRTKAAFVGIYELGVYAERQGVGEVVGMNIGGTVRVRDIEVTMTRALHSCERGSPAGFVLGNDEIKIYHAGDTGLFSDMKLIGELYSPSVACLPIGSYYTMGPVEAAVATELLKPRTVIPMHYGTFPVLEPSPQRFAEELRRRGMADRLLVLEPGEAREL
jgi:L-ascorbate metabolism protein UlaG (beta-lactamase superfamily)